MAMGSEALAWGALAVRLSDNKTKLRRQGSMRWGASACYVIQTFCLPLQDTRNTALCYISRKKLTSRSLQ